MLINTHYLAANVERFIVDSNFSDIDIELVYEPTLLGTGTLLANHDFFRGLGILIHADNAMLDGLEDCYIVIELGVQSTVDHAHLKRTPHRRGTIEHTKVAGDWFFIKVANPPGDTANGAIYVFDDLLINHLKAIDPPPQDFSIDAIPMVNCINTSYS